MWNYNRFFDKDVNVNYQNNLYEGCILSFFALCNVFVYLVVFKLSCVQIMTMILQCSEKLF